jgi:ribonucleotide reductase alpha subunit
VDTGAGVKPFRLTDHFINKYQDITPPFGFNGFGELVFFRTYSRVKDDGTNEVWWETVKRVVEGCYNMQKRHILESHLGWDEGKAQRSAQEMYDRIFNMKFLPPGRGLWAMGAPVIEERGNYAALFNCAFVSTEDIKETLEEPFTFLMDMSMLGVGVGFDTKGAGKITVQGFSDKSIGFTVPDTREGWVESVGLMIRNGLTGGPSLIFDYDQIRGPGLPIKGFGGLSSGPEPLEVLHERLEEVFHEAAGKPLSVETIVDIHKTF